MQDVGGAEREFCTRSTPSNPSNGVDIFSRIFLRFSFCREVFLSWFEHEYKKRKPFQGMVLTAIDHLSLYYDRFWLFCGWELVLQASLDLGWKSTLIAHLSTIHGVWARLFIIISMLILSTCGWYSINQWKSCYRTDVVEDWLEIHHPRYAQSTYYVSTCFTIWPCPQCICVAGWISFGCTTVLNILVYLLGYHTGHIGGYFFAILVDWSRLISLSA